MKVYIIGKTEPGLHYRQEVHPGGFSYGMPGKAFGSAFDDRTSGEENHGQVLIEFAGRLCYESFDLPNEKTKENSGYIRNIISLGHESVLEHVSVTFYVEGVSRNLSHELIRHRHLSFSELSQRYVDMAEANMVVPPASREMAGYVTVPLAASDVVEEYSGAVDELMSLGKTRKQAREAARFVLPSAIETKFVVTGNLRAWRDVLKKRDSKYADAEMQLFAKEVKRQLLEEYPDVLADLNGEDE